MLAGGSFGRGRGRRKCNNELAGAGKVKLFTGVLLNRHWVAPQTADLVAQLPVLFLDLLNVGGEGFDLAPLFAASEVPPLPSHLVYQERGDQQRRGDEQSQVL